MVSVAEALRRVKDDPARVLTEEVIEGACRRHGHRWRDRTLGPVATVHSMVAQALHGNAPIGEIVRLHGASFSGGAFCRARQRLPLDVLLALFHEQHRWAMETVVSPGIGQGLWKGHRTWQVDSTGFSMPDTPELRAYFGQPGNQGSGCGFPVCRTLTLFDWHTAMLLDFVPSPLDTGEGALAPLTYRSMREGDIVLADGNFGTFGQIALAREHRLHAVYEVHAQRAVCFGPGKSRPGGEVVERLGPRDQIVRWRKPQRCPAWMDQRTHAALPESVLVREVRRTVREPGSRKRVVTLVTTLLDEGVYPADALVDLYARRWQIEGSIRTLKHTLKLDVLRCKSVHGVLKELVGIVLVYNMVRMVMLEAAGRQRVEPSRVSFVDALRWWRWAQPGTLPPRLQINPRRPGRHEPRVRKRRAKAYPLMHEPRSRFKARPLRRAPPYAK